MGSTHHGIVYSTTYGGTYEEVLSSIVVRSRTITQHPIIILLGCSVCVWGGGGGGGGGGHSCGCMYMQAWLVYDMHYEKISDSTYILVASCVSKGS